MMTQATRIRSAYGGLPRRAQLAIVGIIAVTAIVMLMVLRAATHTEWVQATDKLGDGNKVEAQKALQTAGIESQLNEQTGALEVPRSDAMQAKATLSEAGIKTHSGCSVVFGKDGSMIASTGAKEAQQARTCREDEIAAQLESKSFIESADVKLTLPTDKLFAEEQGKASALVSIDTGGATVTEKQSQSLVRMIANGAEGLDPSNISLNDEQGNDLNSSASGGSSVDAATMKLRVEEAQNAKIEAKLTQKFEDYVGVGKVKVLSNAKLDMDKITREVKDVGGEKNERGPIEGEDFKFETLNNDGTAVGGVTGVSNNINDTTGSGTAGDSVDNSAKLALDSAEGGANSYATGEGSTKFSNDEVREAIQVAQGNTIANNLSIVVDKSVPADSALAVKNAALAWLGDNRAGAFSFSSAKIASVSEGKKTTSALLKPMGMYLKYVLLGLGMIGMAFFLRRTLNQRTQELLYPLDNPLQLDPSFDPVPLRELEAAVAAASSFDNQKRLELERRIEHIAGDKPQEVAQMLRSWLHDTEPQPGYAAPSRR